MKAMTVGGGPMNADALQRAEQTLGTTFLRVFGMSECLGPHHRPAVRGRRSIRLGATVGRSPAPRSAWSTRTGGAAPAARRAPPRSGAPRCSSATPAPAIRTPPTLTPDGFLPTGDRARVNDDGTITILGREKQIIIRGGRNIDINEVEAAVAALPGVAQVCVVPVPDDAARRAGGRAGGRHRAR